MARVLITGASRGIGRGLADELTKRGHEVIATARDLSSLDDVPAAQRLQLDVTDQASVDAAIAAAGEVDVLISNAGATVRAPLETVPLDEVSRLFELNTFGALRVVQAVLPQMRRRGAGRIAFISSVQGRVAIPLIGPYSASKWALEGIAESLAIEVRHFGVEVQVFEPGAVSSGGAKRAKVFLDKDDPYYPMLEQLAGFRTAPVTVDEFATVVADAVENTEVPFRVPVGEAAIAQLKARKEAPENEPFVAAPLDW
ncbi:SDR family oxidoreductase [Kribbella sp. DT2]|uniref:SDR family oxidoreductase n=1 Tax=Kribbella sp. DT2 TaxID=3393427 RepID=UPI003CEDB3B4